VASLPFPGGERINLTSAEVMLADGQPESMEILVQMFAGFGVHTPRRCTNADHPDHRPHQAIPNL
jgi:hypothetical protein